MIDRLIAWFAAPEKKCPDCEKSEYAYCDRHKYAMVGGERVNRNSLEYIKALRRELGDN